MTDQRASTAGRDPDDREEFLTLVEAAGFLGISQRTLQRLLEQGALRGSKVGRQWRFRKRDLDAYLRSEPEPLPEPPAEDLEAALGVMPAGPLAVRVSTFSGADPDAEASLVPPIVARLADALVQEALETEASDVHVEPHGRGIRVRLRLDGVLHEAHALPQSLHEPLIARFKQLAEMNVSERRLPQVGRFGASWQERQYDFRVSSLPTARGEKLVMRVVVKDASLLLPGLDRLGLSPETRTRLERIVARPHGMIIVTGATGAGKTTTLYTLLNHVTTDAKNVMAAEDPVECLLPGVTQSAVNRKANVGFAALVRAFMTQDPDVIMVGEIRDLETLELICQAAVTGHMVLSALHVDRAVEVPGRMTDIGLAPFLAAGNLTGVLAQRLVPRLCKACRKAGDPDSAELERLQAAAAAGGETPARTTSFFLPAGCEACRGTGYRGRIGLYELMEVTPTVRGALLRRAPEEGLEAVAVSQGMRTLAADGYRKAAEGITSVEEVVRVLTL